MNRYVAEKKKVNIHRRWYGWFLLCCLLLAGLSLWDRYQEDRTAVQIDVADVTGKSSDMMTATGPTDQDGPTIPVSNATEADLIPVYLVGAVACPGIYKIEPGTYLYELIDLAGGLTDQAASDDVNLAASIEINQLIRIPTHAEIDAGYVFALQHTESAAQAMIDLNRADQKQLETLPGIGPATARAIIAYRDENGFFDRIEDLMQVPGIKEARFNTLKDLVTVSAP